MDKNTLSAVGTAAEKKLNLFKNKGRYFVMSMMAGGFVAIGNIFSYASAAVIYSVPSIAGLYPFAIAIPYALSLTLVVFIGAELFLGNVLFMSIAVLQKKEKLARAAFLLLFCYIGNAVGNMLICALYYKSGLMNSTISNLVIHAAQNKLGTSFLSMVINGAFCNMLVCLAVWLCAKLKSETAKIAVIFFLITAFMVSGFENSIANVGTFTMAVLLSGGAVVTPFALATTSLATFIGNLIGGSLFIALPLWFVKKESA